jgi:hypothetical protein
MKASRAAVEARDVAALEALFAEDADFLHVLPDVMREMGLDAPGSTG